MKRFKPIGLTVLVLTLSAGCAQGSARGEETKPGKPPEAVPAKGKAEKPALERATFGLG
jgi:hypothetical protein